MCSPLTKQQQSKFEEMLSQQAASLCREAREIYSSSHAMVANGDTDLPNSVEGWIEILNQYSDNESFQTRRQLERIAAAQEQIELGLYGICSDCESPISLERLLQDPSQQRCGVCEARYKQLSASSKRVWL
ncbi:TraR/DksA family transcriptional regulator [Corallincola platygyrae]|uniref:TraR/DksA family transcriptional regulator n=1 Tax=Corallincola platygyrae TaxID=1193278 RepID=A0ABW4XSL9_9GAMM